LETLVVFSLNLTNFAPPKKKKKEISLNFFGIKKLKKNNLTPYQCEWNGNDK
jgi:hypothetical protein